MLLHSLIFFSVGVVTGLAVPSILQLKWFYPKREKPLLKRALISLERLNDEIFACFLQPSYPDNRYLFERRIHLQKNAFMQAMMGLHNLRSKQTAEMEQLNELFDLMLSYAQLRWRVSDHSVFLLCTRELSQLARIISKTFVRAYREIKTGHLKLNFNYQHLPGAIERLEGNYQQILQVSAKEPINFLLFIANLKLFCEELIVHDSTMQDEKA